MQFGSRILATTLALAIIEAIMSQLGYAAEIRVASAGAFKQVLTALTPQFETATGNKLVVRFQTVGQHLALIRNGQEEFDVAILTPDAIEDLVREGKVVSGSRANLAKVGIGVAVKTGAPLPDIGTVEAFKRTLLAATSVAYIDPKSGGSSGIYVARLLDRLGIASEVNAKAKLIHGGAVANHIADGEAEIGIHQISEILPVAGTTLVGPLPEAIQNFTVYAAGISTTVKSDASARALIGFLSGPDSVPVIKSRGMEPASP